MKKNFFRSEHTSSQIWCFLKFPLWGGQKIKVDQNGVKHGLVLEFLRSDEIFEIWSEKLTGQQASKQASIHTYIHTSGHHSDQISRSALRDGATKKTHKKTTLHFFFCWSKHFSDYSPLEVTYRNQICRVRQVKSFQLLFTFSLRFFPIKFGGVFTHVNTNWVTHDRILAIGVCLHVFTHHQTRVIDHVEQPKQWYNLHGRSVGLCTGKSEVQLHLSSWDRTLNRGTEITFSIPSFVSFIEVFSFEVFVLLSWCRKIHFGIFLVIRWFRHEKVQKYKCGTSNQNHYSQFLCRQCSGQHCSR